MAIKRMRIIISGKVQGVFFRDFAKQNANKRGIVGHAKNLKNGNLELLVQGEESKLDEFVKLCKSGPMMAKVEGVELNYEDVEPEDELEYFDIRFS